MKPESVKIEFRGVDVEGIHSDKFWVVTPVWAGVDRPTCYSMRVRKEKDAKRLAEAMRTGKAFKNPRITTDIHGKTYVEATCLVMGRYLNADLKKLGF